ncbi:hypothetical protein C7974DRAFT_381791 [Boeremia exigua]|uniref:uncharacterized protein n=1 Tax=Boeremia exigua TaxID=749465 RepID=UPI001E8CD526|nr:uncharacterized protein C7974DRAFT_381791 [Boeremia exigua]KAH6643572.1 hypothetical protein C7974DRAFT_381791 [Boeremia exigua]
MATGQGYGLKIFPTKKPPHDTEFWSVSTLRSALKRGHRFQKRDRLWLGVTLASSVLQLHETAWLEENWGIDSIFLIERLGTTAYDHFFVSRCFDQASICMNEAVPRSIARVIRNQTLFALGVALIELWYGQTLDELRIPADDEQSSTTPEEAALLTRYNIADRMAEELEFEADVCYSGAVRRCIRCTFDAGINKFNDAKFRRAVYQGVVMQLQKTYEFTIGHGDS